MQDYYNKIIESINKAVTEENEALKENVKNKNYSKKLSDNTIEIIKKREILNRKENKTTTDKIEHTELRKLAKKEIRKDVLKYEQKMIEEIMKENASTKKVYKNLSITKRTFIQSICTEEGVFTDREKIVEEMTKYYENLYKNDNINDEESRIELQENVSQSSKEDECEIQEYEVEAAIKKLKSEKMPGEDGISNELIKEGGTHLIKHLNLLFNMILVTNEIPKEWNFPYEALSQKWVSLGLIIIIMLL